jgi:hypothetical protein
MGIDFKKTLTKKRNSFEKGFFVSRLRKVLKVMTSIRRSEFAYAVFAYEILLRSKILS